MGRFFSNYFYVLSHIIYAHEQGWHCVVDMKNYPTLYSEDDIIFETDNCWEYYFEQPDKISLNQAYLSKNYILSNGSYKGDKGVPVYSINQGHITESMIRNLYPIQENFLRVKQPFIDEVNNFFSKNMSIINGLVFILEEQI